MADTVATQPSVASRHEPATTAQPGPVARALIGVVRAYQRIFAGRPSPCRYWPSCSAYAVEALQLHGAWKGSRLAVWRILRCNPFAGHGVDPVPDPTPAHSPATKKRASRRV